ncbi:MAG: T9SS type A sorting domain-containing protein [Bacteroidota bacterium]|jgi:hypothetical protein
MIHTIRKKQCRVYAALLLVSTLTVAQWKSSLLTKDETGRLVYSTDQLGNRIPDFSYAGFKNGEVPLPAAAVVKTIGPAAGDNTGHIQQAIDEIAAMPKGSDGLRGALLLLPGMYRVSGTVRVNESGIVLRGSGDGSDSTNNTVIFATGDNPHQRSVIIAGGGTSTKWSNKVSGTEQNITSDTIAAGSRTFTVQNPSLYSTGDNIIIYYPCTDAWLKTIDYGGSHSGEPGADSVDVPWKVNSYPIVYNRNITAIHGDTVVVDVPFFYTMIRSLSPYYLYTYARTGLKTMIGIENLRVDIEAVGSTADADGDEDHAWNAVEMKQIEDSWVRNCTMLHFGHAGVITSTAARLTIEDCSAIDPISIITGERRYNFNVYVASQQILFNRCHAVNGRHHFVSNGTSWTSGCVFLDCTSSGAYASSEGHRSWSQGLLWDSMKELDGPRNGLKITLGLYNRGYYGTSHGWAVVNSAAWNCDERTGALIVQRPPTGQNYGIGCKGIVTGAKPPAPFDHPGGFIEGTGESTLEIPSLYKAQLEERMTDLLSVKKNGDQTAVPKDFFMLKNYPNPFNPGTTIEFSCDRGGPATVKVFDSTGRLVTTLFTGDVTGKKKYFLKFNASGFSSGGYFVRASSDGFSSTLPIQFIK